jgi:hypothetical protein
MPGFIEADTGYLLEVADHLDPAAVTAAKTAAGQARASALACGDPLPGCQAFSTEVARVADEIIAFCTQVEEGVRAYASVAAESAGLYGEANSTSRSYFGGNHGRG